MLALTLYEDEKIPLTLGNYRIEFDGTIRPGDDGASVVVVDAKLVSFTMLEADAEGD